MGVRIVDKAKEFMSANTETLDTALARMAQDIKILAIARSPYKSGALQRTADAKTDGKLKHRVVFDKEYASYQERGSRADGSHVVRKYSTPSTGKNFLKDAGQSVAERAINYLVQAASRVRI